VTSRAERVAANEAVFRDANEVIRSRAGTLELEAPDRVPFLCECADPGCTEVIRLTLEAYEEVRADSHTFAIVPGHEAAESETVVDVGPHDDGVSVVAKKPAGHAITEKTDPRR
jgi:hypothetical protein